MLLTPSHTFAHFSHPLTRCHTFSHVVTRSCSRSWKKTMKLKQRLHDGDRSHPSIVALDETKASLSYPGWRSDAAKAEMVWGFDMFSRYLPGNIDKSVATMKRKQECHEAEPPNVLTAVCRSGASQVNRLLNESGERFGYLPTLTATSALVAFPLSCALAMSYSP